MKIALYQGPGVINDPDAAFALMERRAVEAKASGADLLLMPEMFLSGYNIGPENALKYVVTAAGLAPARRVAKAHGIALVFGYPELVGEEVANSAVLIGPDRICLATWTGRCSSMWGLSFRWRSWAGRRWDC